MLITNREVWSKTDKILAVRTRYLRNVNIKKKSLRIAMRAAEVGVI